MFPGFPPRFMQLHDPLAGEVQMELVVHTDPGLGSTPPDNLRNRRGSVSAYLVLCPTDAQSSPFLRVQNSERMTRG